MAQSVGKMSKETERWEAVRTRDQSASTEFVYAVKTTGVFCRPGCSSRRPKRENVLFFDSANDARLAGFRACRRCRPADKGDGEPTEAVVLACRLIEQAVEPLPLDELSRRVGYSPSYFHRKFKQLVGVTPKAYAAAQRAERARNDLRETDGSTLQSAMRAGFGSSARFYQAVADNCGMTPQEVRQSGAGATIHAAIASSTLGLVLVAATEKGVCLIELGTTRPALQERLRETYARAKFVQDDRRFEEWVRAVVEVVDGRRLDCGALPLDIQGTSFQRQVWEELRKVPGGRTVTYTELAKRVGRPRAVRAVGSACAANRLAIAIPCHRAVRSDGSLSGYRWGVDRKRDLLQREQR